MKKKQLGERFNYNGPTNALLVSKVEAEVKVSFPKDYIDFLYCANGGEGFIENGAYVILWRVEDLPKLNRAYQVEQYAPGLFLFGSDGGGEAFAFDMRKEVKPIVSVPFVGMNLDTIREIAETFASFIDRLSKMDD